MERIKLIIGAQRNAARNNEAQHEKIKLERRDKIIIGAQVNGAKRRYN